MAGTIEHKCPNCGGTITFDIGTQSVLCEFCGSSFDPDDLLVKDENLFIDPEDVFLPMSSGTVQETTEFTEYSCSSCGAALYTDETTSATICPFCGSSVILKGRLSGTLLPDKVIPFKVTKEEALTTLQDRCKHLKFVHQEFRDNKELSEVKGLYVPYWVYSTDLEADLVFTGIKQKTILPGKQGDVVEKKYYKVTRKGTISFDHVPADASSRMPDDLMETLEPFDYGESVDFGTSYISGYVADRYDVPQEEVMPRIRNRIGDGTEEAFRSTISGYDTVLLKQGDLDVRESSVSYVLYPVWLFKLRWRDESFTFAINGQTGKFAGDLPLDKKKLGAVTIGVFALLVAISCLIFGWDLHADEVIDFAFWTILLSAIAAGFVHFWYSSELKNVEFQKGSREYYREDSLKVEVSEEEFLFKKVEIE